MRSEIKFKRDTSFRKQFFVPDSFAHPAKMDAQLLIWLTENYTKVGETVLDPMAGSGTTMLACTLGRHCILVDLEEKFCKMMRDNWTEVRMRPQIGSQMGNCQIIQGDARNLEGLLADRIITSPPYADSPGTPSLGSVNKDDWGKQGGDIVKRRGLVKGYGGSADNIGNLPYGDIDKIITSPPYAEAQSGGGIAQKGYQGPKHGPTDLVGKRSYMPENVGDNPDQISNLPYGNIDKIITSPPYEKAIHKQDEGHPDIGGGQRKENFQYSQTSDNIGNLKGDTYLEAMALVYSQCFTVLRDGGLLILVTKNFIRNKQVIRLDTDTSKLCEQAGFSFVERHFRRLPAQSFWRTIYQQKYPDVEVIQNEDVLVFQK